MNNYAGLVICIARRLAQSEKTNQQATIIQTAARLLSGADDETKESLMRFIALAPQERHESLNLTERLFIGEGK